MLLGCIADDFTGATDLANMLVKGGMRTVQIIGVPVAEATGAAGISLTGVDAIVVALKSRTIACPAFPENGRTIFRGYLYVGDVLLSESGMKDHPLTPMTDANLVRPVKTCRWSRPDPALALALRSMRVPRGGLRTRQTPRHTHGSQALHAQLHHVIEYRPRRGPPRAAIGTNVLQRASQLAQAMRLADQIGMQRNAHHQWLAAACACIARRT